MFRLALPSLLRALPLLFTCALFVAAPAAQDVPAGQVNVIRVEGVISPSSADYIVTNIKQAEKDKYESGHAFLFRHQASPFRFI